MRLLLATFAVAMTCISSCDDGKPSGPAQADGIDATNSLSSVDSGGVRVLSNTSDSIRLLGHSDSQPKFRIRNAEAGPLHRVRAAGYLSNGTIVVADGGTSTLNVYDTTGKLLSSAGRGGQGPGEFEDLSSMVIVRGTLLQVYDSDADRISTFDAATLRLISTVPLTDNAGARMSGLAAITADSTFILREGTSLNASTDAARGSVRDTIRMAEYSKTGQFIRWLNAHETAEFFTEPGRYGSRQWAPRRLARPISSGTVEYDPYATQLEFRDFDGRLKSIVRWRSKARALRGDAIRAAISASDAPAEQKRQILDIMTASPHRFADVLAAHDRLVLARNGQLWLRHTVPPWDADPGASIGWDVLTPEGVFSGVMNLPHGFVPAEILHGRVLGVFTDASGVEEVHEYALVLATSG